MKKYIMET